MIDRLTLDHDARSPQLCAKPLPVEHVLGTIAFRFPELPTLTHFTTFSRSHADMLISHAEKNSYYFFFFFLLVRDEGYPYCDLCLQNRGKNFEVEEKSVGVPPPPPPPHQLFWDLRNFIGWQRTALAFLTPNPHPMLAALDFVSESY